MSAIKKFFEKKKLEYKFKKLGAGHSLAGDSSDQTPAPTSATRPNPTPACHQQAQKQLPSDGAQRAAAAAMARAAQPKPGSSAMAAKRAKIRAELAQEEKTAAAAAGVTPGPSVTTLDSVPMCRVLYRCELFDEGVSYPKSEIDVRIESFLTAQLQEDPVEAGALIIKTTNKNPEKIQTCVDTIKKIIQNITTHPGEEKYLKIRSNNKALRERVFDLKGAREYLIGAGFQPTQLPADDGSTEEFLLMSLERGTDAAALTNLLDILESAERICPVLDPDPRLFYPTSKLNSFNVPDEFYAISKEELKREAELRKEAVEKMGMLRTKAMRERDEQRELRKYRYTAIRVRFPNGLILQGTFTTRSPFLTLVSFIRESLSVDWLPFAVIAPSAGGRLDEGEHGTKTLAELALVPSAVVNVTFDEELLAQCRQSFGSDFYFVKDELLQNIERL